MGDRNISITIKRGLVTVPLPEIISFFIFGNNKLSSALKKVVEEERDTYMAHELKKVTENLIEDAFGSLKPPVVVAVVGRAHVAGILEKIDKVNAQDVAEIIQIPPFYRSIVMMEISQNWLQ